MDLGTLLNRVYLDHYKNQVNFWYDLGLVFKNCRKFNTDPNTDIRILCDTLRECAVVLYKQWFKISKEKFENPNQENPQLITTTAQNEQLSSENKNSQDLKKNSSTPSDSEDDKGFLEE